ncbi:unnamed protein product [Moneuplotes crassus]|uniref:C2H2-type domain-containing protein n=1 Tax=Euplotes crassus TaxID=5936 RepID=A0AAD2CZI0_EUPCR|nr:unnamed protein product [Moneuplotes crassus]
MNTENQVNEILYLADSQPIHPLSPIQLPIIYHKISQTEVAVLCSPFISTPPPPPLNSLKCQPPIPETSKAPIQPSLASKLDQATERLNKSPTLPPTNLARSKTSKPIKLSQINEIGILKNFQCNVYSKRCGPKRTKKYIQCRYQNCAKIFTRTWNFIDHARMHLGIKPYRCSLCGAQFTQKCNLNSHISKIHTERRLNNQ